MASAKLYLDTRSSVGLMAPVKAVISHNRKSAYLSLGVKAPIEKWDSQTLSLKGKENRNLQLFIMQKKLEIDEALLSIARRGIPNDTTALQLRDMVISEVFPKEASEKTVEHVKKEPKSNAEHKDCFLYRFRQFMESRPT